MVIALPRDALSPYTMHATNKLISIGLTSLALGAGSHAAPFMAIGDGAEIFLTGSLGVRVDDNIFLSGSAEDDVIFDINPGVDLTFGKGAQVQGSLTLVHAFATYADNNNLNTNLFSGDFVTRYDDGKMKLNFNAGFHELNQNSVDVRGLTRRDIFSSGANSEVEISQLTAVGAGVRLNRENYKRAGYTDSENLTVPLDFYYKWTPKVDLSVGYRYRDHEVDIGQDSTDHYFNVGARGEFTPKLVGRFTVGFNRRSLDVTGAKNGFGLDASLTYEVSPKTSLQMGASNDFGTSPQGQQQENLTMNARLVTKIASDWSVNGGLSFRSIDYGTRTDDYWEAGAGTVYIVNANITILGAYVHREYSSDIRGADFKNNVFSVAANFRY
jgi:polysaccharide biosynthesis protein VpsM